MENNLLIKRIETLEKEIKELKKENLNMFGRSYNQVGSSSSDLVLNTRGLIKIRYGNKFIDLIKNGKINTEFDFIYKISDKNSISKNGIYITDNNEIYIKYESSNPILIPSEELKFISFNNEQELTSDLKYQALKNIGIIYSDLNVLSNSGIKNGIVFIEESNKLYTVKNGIPEELIFNYDTKENSKLNELSIKNIKNDTYLESIGNLIINSNTIINKAGINTKNIVISSLNSPNNSFLLEEKNGESYLTVDYLNLTNSTNSINIPLLYFTKTNIIKSINKIQSNEEILNLYEIQLYLTNEFLDNDILSTYVIIENNNNEITEYSIKYITFKIINSNTLKIQVELQEEFDEDITSISGHLIFLIQSNNYYPIQILGNTLQILNLLKFGNLGEKYGIQVVNGEYLQDLEELEENGSNKFASTKWVLEKLKNNYATLDWVIKVLEDNNLLKDENI